MQISYTSLGALSALFLTAPDPSKMQRRLRSRLSEQNAPASETRLPEAWKREVHKWQSCLLGFVIMTQSWKFIRGQCYSHYFDDADSNGGKIFGIKILLGIANRRRNFGFLSPNHENMSTFKHILSLTDTSNWNKHWKTIRFQCFLRSYRCWRITPKTPAPCTPSILGVQLSHVHGWVSREVEVHPMWRAQIFHSSVCVFHCFKWA